MRSSDYLPSQAFIAEAVMSQASDAFDIVMKSCQLDQLCKLREELPAQANLTCLEGCLKRCSEELETCERGLQDMSPRRQNNLQTYAARPAPQEDLLQVCKCLCTCQEFMSGPLPQECFALWATCIGIIRAGPIWP